jgi:hypothetical protein
LVADGTRPASLEKAIAVKGEAEQQIGGVRFVVALNKCDLVDEWAISPEKEAEMTKQGWNVARTSAKTGEGVDEVFQILVKAMLAP